MNAKLFSSLILFGFVLNTYSQNANSFSFFGKSNFDWKNWEVRCEGDGKKNIIEKLLKSPTGEKLKKIEYNIKDFHLVDINSDGKLDVIYEGFMDSEKNSVLLFVNEKGFYIEKINTHGSVIEINRELPFLPINIKIMDTPCCENNVYKFEYYNYFIEKNIISYKRYKKIKFLRANVFPKIDSNQNFTFKTIAPKYNLRSSPMISKSNIIAVYPENSIGIAIYSKKDDNRVWWLVIMKNNLKRLKTVFLEEGSEIDNYYSIGWMSDKKLKKLNSNVKI